MASLENSALENVHIIHKSLTVLLIKGLIAWLIIAAVYFIGAMVISSSSTIANGGVALETISNFWTSIAVSLIILFLYGALILYITLDWILNYYVLDSTALVTRLGIIFTKETSYDLGGIESIEVTQGLFGRVFGFGTLILSSPVLERKLKLPFIPDPYAEAQFIHRMHPNPQILHFLPKK